MKLTVFDNWHEGVRSLPETEQDAFYGAVARYMFEGTEPSLEGVAAAVWAVVKPMLDTSREGQENGAKGGNGRGNKTPSENPSEKPSSKRGGENQKKRIERKGREGEGFPIPEKLGNHSHGGDAADAEGSAPPPPEDVAAIFAEAEALAGADPFAAEAALATARAREAHDAMVSEAVPCPDHLRDPFKAVG